MQPDTATRAENLIHEYRLAKATARGHTASLIKLAVEEIGLPQEDVVNRDVAALVEGYLIGLRQTAR